MIGLITITCWTFPQEFFLFTTNKIKNLVQNYDIGKNNSTNYKVSSNIISNVFKNNNKKN